MGGYKVIDLGGVDIDETGVVIPGIYDAIEGSHKAILLEGISIDGTEYKPFYPHLYVSGSDYVFEVPGSTDTVTIDGDDTVTYVPAE